MVVPKHVLSIATRDVMRNDGATIEVEIADGSNAVKFYTDTAGLESLGEVAALYKQRKLQEAKRVAQDAIEMAAKLGVELRRKTKTTLDVGRKKGRGQTMVEMSESAMAERDEFEGARACYEAVSECLKQHDITPCTKNFEDQPQFVVDSYVAAYRAALKCFCEREVHRNASRRGPALLAAAAAFKVGTDECRRLAPMKTQKQRANDANFVLSVVVSTFVLNCARLEVVAPENVETTNEET